MRNYILLFSVLLMSCASKTNEEKNNAPARVNDTLQIDKQVYQLDSISEAEYTAVYKAVNAGTDENGTADDTVHITQDRLRIVFHLKNGADSVLESDTSSDNFTQYSVLKSYNTIDYWLVQVSYSEGGSYLLVDKTDGSKIWICGVPEFSPDNRLFACSSFDLVAAFDINGIELYDIKNGKAVLRWSKEVSDWGPASICWKSNSILYIEQSRINDSTGMPAPLLWKAMNIEKK